MRMCRTVVVLALLVVSSCGAESGVGPVEAEGQAPESGAGSTNTTVASGALGDGAAFESAPPGSSIQQAGPGSEVDSPANEPSNELSDVPSRILDAVLADAASRAGESLSAVRVLLASAVEWPDSSLGCPEPGKVYLQALTPGYHIVVEVGSKSYDYRASAEGAFKLCEQEGDFKVPEVPSKPGPQPLPPDPDR